MPSTGQEPDHRPAEPSLFESPQKQNLVFCLLIVLATVALYNPVTRAPFLNFDDNRYVTENPDVRDGLSWHSVAWAFQTSAEANWHPVTWLSHQLDCQVFGLNPAGPHTINVLLHTACAVLLFLILQSVTGMRGRSLMAAALFALHPINVESVAWIAERKNVLSMLFFLLALAAYGWYARRPGIWRYLAVTLLYALGLLTKPQVITFPFALLLLDYWPLRRMSGADEMGGSEPHESRPAERGFIRLVWEKAPWFAMSAASALITMRVQSLARHEDIPLWIRLGNAALSYATYVEKAFWPVHLAPAYPHPEGSIGISAAVLAALAILAGSVLVAIFRGRRYLFVGWFWFLGTLVPMIGLVQVGVQSMADRYAYIPLLGIFVIVCWGVADLARSWRVPRAVPAVAGVVILSALGFALHRQVGYWGDNLTLWSHTLDVTQKNFIAEDNVATALLAENRTEEAMQHFQRAQAIRPGDPISTLNIASYEQQQGNYQVALEGYRKVFRLTTIPVLVAMAHANGGYAHYSLKEYDRAKQDFEAALQQQAQNSPAYLGLGLLAQRSGDWAEAAQDYLRAVQIQPTPVGYLLLAQALESGGQLEAANAARSRAAAITPDLSGAMQAVKQLLAN